MSRTRRLFWIETQRTCIPEADVVADLAARLHTRPPSERHVAVVSAGNSDADHAAAVTRALREAGYRTGELPGDAAALSARLARTLAEEKLSFAEYSAFFASLPSELQRHVTGRWGAAERDPFFRPGRLDCGHFVIPGLRDGNVAVLHYPASDSAADTAHEPVIPRHSQIAICAWLIDGFRADAVIDLAKRDELRWIRTLAEQA